MQDSRAVLASTMVVALLAAASLPSARAASASLRAAAFVDQYAVVSETNAVSLSIFEAAVGSKALVLGATDAFGTNEPLASSAITPVVVLGNAVLGDQFTSSSTGERVSNPESADGCLADVTVPGIDVGGICAKTTAQAGPFRQHQDQDASATLTGADVDVDGRFIADLLTNQIGVFLQNLLDGIGGELISGEPVAAALTELVNECDVVLGEVADGADPDDQLPAAVNDLLALTGAELQAAKEVAETLANPVCSQLLSLQLDELTADLLDLGPLADALAGLDLIEVTVSAQRSSISGASTAVGSLGEQVFVEIDGPSLDALDDIVSGLAEAALNGVVAEIETTLGQDFFPQEDVQSQLDDFLDQIPLLDDSAPLLRAVASGGTASAQLLMIDGVTSGSGELPYVEVTIAPSVLELFGQDPEQGTLTLTAGQTQTIAEGTPLETTISVGDNEVTDGAELGDSGLFGTMSFTSATTLQLLTGLEGGVELSLGASAAGAYADTISPAPRVLPSTQTTPEGGELPNTGGGAALVAALAVGAAFALRRRRD